MNEAPTIATRIHEFVPHEPEEGWETDTDSPARQTSLNELVSFLDATADWLTPIAELAHLKQPTYHPYGRFGGAKHTPVQIGAGLYAEKRKTSTHMDEPITSWVVPYLDKDKAPLEIITSYKSIQVYKDGSVADINQQTGPVAYAGKGPEAFATRADIQEALNIVGTYFQMQYNTRVAREAAEIAARAERYDQALDGKTGIRRVLAKAALYLTD